MNLFIHSFEPHAVPARTIMARALMPGNLSEHRRAVTSSLFGQERGLVRDVESSLEGGTRWFEEFRWHPSHKPHLSLQR